jgi:hypothetical protein
MNYFLFIMEMKEMMSNVEDTARLLSINKARGFPGVIGSIDCMH